MELKGALLGVFVTNPRGRSLVDVLLSKQPSVNETSCSTGAVSIQPHVPDPTRAQIASVGGGDKGSKVKVEGQISI